MTVQAGQRVNASDVAALQQPPRCQAIQLVAQSIPNGVQTSITLDSEDEDTDGIHSTVTNTNRLTIVTPGTYEFSGQVVMTANATGTRDARILKNTIAPNGLRKVEVPNATVSTQVLLGPVSVSCVAGDIFELAITQTSGGALNTISVNALNSFLRCLRIGD